MRRVFGTTVGQYLPALGLLCITAAYLVAAYGYRPDTREIPAGVAWAMLVLVGLDFASRTRTRLGQGLTRWLNPAAQTAPHATYSASKQALAIFWVAGFATALVLLGILYAVPLFVFASMRWRGRMSYLVSLAGCGGVTVVIWLLFSMLLRIELYPGILFGGG